VSPFNSLPGTPETWQRKVAVIRFGATRRYLHYRADEAHQVLYLEDKNQGSDSDDPNLAPKKNVKPKPVKKLVWHYSRPTDSRIILSGLDDQGNSLYVVLDRIDEKYPIQIASPIPSQPLHYDRTYARRYPVTSASFDGKGEGGDCGRACM